MRTQDNTITSAIRKAAHGLRYPGPWADYQGQPLDEFLVELGNRPAVPDQTPWGRLIFREPLKDALAAMPFLYRSSSQQLIARYFFEVITKGESDMQVAPLCHRLHENLTMIRSLLAARLNVDLGEEFAQGTTPITIVESKPWQAEGETDPDAEGETMWVSCTIEDVIEDFANAIGEGRREQTLNWANSLLIAQAGEHMADIDWEGWDKVAIDRQFNTERKMKLKDQLASNDPSKKFWAVNKAYRALVKTLRSLEGSHAYWTWRLDQAGQKNTGMGKEGPRPFAESYTGGEEELIEIGRISHILGSENYDYSGNRAGGPEREVLQLIESEIADLGGLIDTLEQEQRKIDPIWKVMGHSGVPYWYNRIVTVVKGQRVESYESYSIDQKAEAEAAMAKQREEWLKGRMGEQIKTLTPQERRMLAELAKFDDVE